MIITKKIRVFPSVVQQKVLLDLSEKCRLIYNFALKERIDNWAENKIKTKEDRMYITYNKQQDDLPSLKKKYPEYKWNYSKVYQGTLKKLDADYKSFFASWKNGDLNARLPRFKGKHHFTVLVYNQSGFKIDENSIVFSHKHPSAIPLKFKIDYSSSNGEKIKQVEIFNDSREKWFITLSIEFNEPAYIDNGLYQAIDLGIINITTAVNSSGKFIQIKNQRSDLYWKNKIEEVHSWRDHCKKHSKKWNFYNKKLKRMQRNLANQMKDFQHKISKKIVENTRANTIIIGDLDIKDMSRHEKDTGNPRQNKARKTLHHSLQSTGSMGRFAEFLTYKAEKIGKRVTRIDESMTTKTCCICGKIRHRKLSERTIICDCGNILDRDKNSAVNIMIRFLSRESLLNGELLKQEFLINLHRQTALPVVEAAMDSMRTRNLISG